MMSVSICWVKALYYYFLNWLVFPIYLGELENGIVIGSGLNFCVDRTGICSLVFSLLLWGAL